MSNQPASQKGAVSTVTLDIGEKAEYWAYITSDIHIDAVTCNRKYLIQDLNEAVKRDAMIFIIGDLFDAMQGRFDPRRSMDSLRPEYRRNDYYDFVIRDVGDILSPYAKFITMISDGNHELSVLKNANTNLADRLVERLNNTHGGKVLHGGYGGWVRFMMEKNGTPQGSIKLKYFHGSGGEAPVTRGALQTSRQQVYLPDADIIANGHSHHQYWIPIVRERLSNKGELRFDACQHIRTPGYNQEYGDGSTGWAATSGKVPKPIGGFWIKFALMQHPTTPTAECIPNLHSPVPISIEPNLYTGIVFPQE